MRIKAMFRDPIAASKIDFQPNCEREMRQAYTYFFRKYPLPHILGEGI